MRRIVLAAGTLALLLTLALVLANRRTAAAVGGESEVAWASSVYQSESASPAFWYQRNRHLGDIRQFEKRAAANALAKTDGRDGGHNGF